MNLLSTRAAAAFITAAILSGLTSAHAGVIRLNATINAAQETNGSTSTATGSAVMLYDVTANRYDLTVTLSNFTEVLNDSHIHEAPTGQSAAPVELIGGENAVGSLYVRSGNTITATFTNVEYSGSPATLIAGGAYLNYHTTLWASGAIRGQLIPEPVHLTAIMNAAQEVGAHTPVNSTAYGAAQATYDPATDQISVIVCVYNFTNTLTNSHIHEGAVGASGGVKLGFGAAAAYQQSGTSYVQLFQNTYRVSATNPAPNGGDPLLLLSERAYVNVHSNVYGPGEIRGQLYVMHPSNAGRLVNVSSRGNIGTGSNVLISGFFVQGTEPVRVLVTTRGPSFASLVTGTIADPTLSVYDTAGRLLFTNDNVGTAPFQSLITAFTSVSFTAAEAGALLVLPPGGYTIVASGVNNTTGIGIGEAFEVNW